MHNHPPAYQYFIKTLAFHCDVVARINSVTEVRVVPSFVRNCSLFFFLLGDHCNEREVVAYDTLECRPLLYLLGDYNNLD